MTRETILASGVSSEPPIHTQATARPWRNSTADETAIVGRDMDDVASTFFGDEDYDDNYATRAADATLIVKAVNNFDALTEALENLIRCSNAIVGASTDDPEAEESFHMFNDARNIARAALAGAK